MEHNTDTEWIRCPSCVAKKVPKKGHHYNLGSKVMENLDGFKIVLFTGVTKSGKLIIFKNIYIVPVMLGSKIFCQGEIALCECSCFDFKNPYPVA